MNLYVGNLDYGVTNQSLEELFAQFGSVVSAKIIMDRDTGRSKGFGFVEMSDKSEAIKAMSSLNGQEVNGRGLRVNEAQDKNDNRNKNW